MNFTKRTDLKTPSWQYDFRHEGKRYRKSGFKTKKEAQYAANEELNTLKQGAQIDKSITFAEYYTLWVENNGKMHLSAPQVDWYKRAYKYVCERLGEDYRLSAINRQVYQGVLNKYGEGRSKATVRKLHGILAQVLRDATYDGYIERDPTYKIKINGSEPAKKEEDKYIKIQEYLDLIEYFKSRSEKSYILLYILAITGARFSEVNEMKYEDLKLGAIHLPGTKTENADRDVEVNQNDIERIKERLKRHPRRMDGYLFKLSHNGVKRSMNYAKEQIGMDDKKAVTTYALRHTHCSYLISQGIPIEYISKRLGHSSIAITLKYYAHLLDEQKEEQGQHVREIFGH